MGCLDPILTISAIVSSKSPFVSSFDDRNAADIAKLNFVRGDSDLLAMLDAYNGWKALSGGYRECNEYCTTNYLSYHTLQQIDQMRGQFLDLLKGIGFVPQSVNITNLRSTESVCNRNGSSECIIKTVLCAGLCSNVLMLPTGSRSVSNRLSKTLGEFSLQSKRGSISVVT